MGISQTIDADLHRECLDHIQLVEDGIINEIPACRNGDPQVFGGSIAENVHEILPHEWLPAPEVDHKDLHFLHLVKDMEDLFQGELVRKDPAGTYQAMLA